MSNIKHDLARMENAFQWMQSEFDSTEEFKTQNISILIDKVNLLCNTLPWVNSQMAIAKKKLNEAKVKAYQRLNLSSKAQNETFSPMLAKDYVNALCSEEQYAYDVAERCSRTIVHLVDAMRTCISALKTEHETSKYY